MQQKKCLPTVQSGKFLNKSMIDINIRTEDLAEDLESGGCGSLRIGPFRAMFLKNRIPHVGTTTRSSSISSCLSLPQPV